MKTKVLISFFILLLLFQKCKEKKKVNTVKKFPSEINIKGKGIDIPLQIGDLIVTDSLFIFFNPWNKHHLFYIFNKNDHKFIKPIGKRGKGPNEIIRPGNFIFSKTNNSLIVFDHGDNNFHQFTINKENETTNKDNYLKFPNKYNEIVFEMNIIDSTRRVISCGIDKSILKIIDKKNKVTKEIGVNPYYQENIKRFTAADLFWRKIETHPTKKEIIVVIFLNYDRIMAFDINKDSLIFDNVGPDFIEHKIEYYSTGAYKPSEKSKEGYFDIAVSNSFIYALYSGYKEKSGKYPDQIFVFNWEGKPVAKLNLDREIWAIELDNKKKLIYGITPKSMKPLVRYEIPLTLINTKPDI